MIKELLHVKYNFAAVPVLDLADIVFTIRVYGIVCWVVILIFIFIFYIFDVLMYEFHNKYIYIYRHRLRYI